MVTSSPQLRKRLRRSICQSFITVGAVAFAQQLFHNGQPTGWFIHVLIGWPIAFGLGYFFTKEAN